MVNPTYGIQIINFDTKITLKSVSPKSGRDPRDLRDRPSYPNEGQKALRGFHIGLGMHVRIFE